MFSYYGPYFACILILTPLISAFSLEYDDLPSQRDAMDALLSSLSRKSREPMEHEPEEAWKGRWFPDKTGDSPLSRHRPPVPSYHPPYPPMTSKELDHINYINSMINPYCDDGKTNLTVDWDESPEDYLCLLPPDVRFLPDPERPAVVKEDFIPFSYSAGHLCLDRKIVYPPGIVTYGSHRAAWPHYGEYVYVPPQRYLHSAEHGAVVMLYHPCAHPMAVEELRQVVRSCLRRHIITPSRLLSKEYPLALITWGWSLRMSAVDAELASEFISRHALRGTEQIPRDGLFSHGLLRAADLVSDENDSRLCPGKPDLGRLDHPSNNHMH